MDQGQFLFHAMVYLAAAVVAVPVAKRLGLGSVLGYLVAGVAIGPFGLGLVGAEGQDVLHFAEFGVVMMLFLIGLELQPALLWRMRGPILGLGGSQVALTGLAVGAVCLAIGLDWRASLAVGMTLALSSTAIVLQTLSEKGLMGTAGGQRSFSVLLFQDIAVIPMLALLPLLGHGPARAAQDDAAHHGTTWTAGLPGWASALVVVGAVIAVILVGRFVVRPFFRWIARTRLREVFTAASLLLVVGIAELMGAVGLSPALGTFLAGVVLANSEFRHELEADIEPFKGLLLGVFFIAVGASIDFARVAADLSVVTVSVAGLVAIKFVILAGLGRLFGLALDQTLLFAFALAEGGEFAFVLFSFAEQNRVLSSELTATLVAVVALSMIVTPLLLMLNEKWIKPRFGTRERESREADAVEGECPVIIAGFGRFGHIVGRMLRANGVGCTVLDVDSDQVDILRKFGIKVFYGDASRFDLLRAAGAEHAKVLVLAIDQEEKRLEIVRTVRKHFPHLTILARARGRADAYEQLDAGVEHVYRETLDSSLRMAIDALRLLGVRGYQAHRAARIFRVHDERSVRELARMRHDEQAYIRRAREVIADLERVILEDARELPHAQDAAWDTASLRRELGGGDVEPGVGEEGA